MKLLHPLRALAALAGLLGLPALAGAQEPAPASPPAAAAPAPEATPAPASPTPAPTPLPLLMGPAYDTLRTLSEALKTEMEHVMAAAGAPGQMVGRRMFLMNARMFARRSAHFRQRVETYRTQPFDIVAEVTQMNTRATLISNRLRNAQLLESAQEDWTVAIDVLDRMSKLLAGQAVTVPPAHTPRPRPSPAAGAVDTDGRMRQGMPQVASPAPAASPVPSPSPSPSASPRGN
jgi:hypothetical protein